MPAFFSNSQNKVSKKAGEKNNSNIELYNSVSINSKNASIANLNLSKEGATPHVNKIPCVVSGNPDKYAILKRNGKFCMCRLLSEDSQFNSNKLKQNVKQKAEDESEVFDSYWLGDTESFCWNIEENYESEEKQGIICGLYCQYTTSDVQRNIIATVLKQYFKKKPFIYTEAIMGNTGECGNEKMIITSKWWRDWWDYVNFESLFESKLNDETANKGTNNINFTNSQYKMITKWSNKNIHENSRESYMYK